MARIQIVADARWLTSAVWNVLLFLALLLAGVFLAGGLWWTLAVLGVLIVVVVLIWRAVRS